MHNQEVLKSTLDWLTREMGNMEYGDVGVVFSFSKGQITKIKRVNEECIAHNKATKGGEKVK